MTGEMNIVCAEAGLEAIIKPVKVEKGWFGKKVNESRSDDLEINITLHKR